eukprot:403352292
MSELQDSEIQSLHQSSHYTDDENDTASQISLNSFEADSTIDPIEKAQREENHEMMDLDNQNQLIDLNNQYQQDINSTHSTSSATPCKSDISFKNRYKPQVPEFNPDDFTSKLSCSVDNLKRLREIWKLQNSKCVFDTETANLYFQYRDPLVFNDQYSGQPIIEVLKPLKMDVKMKCSKMEVKKIEKLRKQQEREKAMLSRDSRQDYYNPKDGEVPYWHILSKDKFQDLINNYKYPLQRMLTVEQIQNMRKMLVQENNDGQKGGVGTKKEKAYSRCETKKQQEKYRNAAAIAARESSRPRRQAAQNANIQMNLSSKDPDDSFRAQNQHELVECQRFLTEMHQPIVLFITLEALFTMNVHAHVHRNEIIGFVSGHRVKTKKIGKDVFIIQETVPCQAMVDDYGNTDYSKNVEMNPESAEEKVKEIESKGLQILGWYHSHPKFEANPSHIDVQNHETYQKMFNRDGKYFMALIIAPYYSTTDVTTKFNSLPKLKCFVTVFNKETERIMPYELAINVLPQTRLNKELILNQVREIQDNPFAFDKIQLKNEACVLKCSKNNQIHLKKGEKLIRSLKQLIEFNAIKVRKEKVTASHIARHFEGLTMLQEEMKLPDKLDDKTDPDCIEQLKRSMRLRGRYKNKNFNTTNYEDMQIDENFEDDEQDQESGVNTSKKDWYKSIDLRTIATSDECHMNLALTLARIRTKYFKAKGEINDYCMKITVMGHAERFIDQIKEILDTGEDTYFSENE